MKSILVITLFVSLGLQQVGYSTSAEDHYNLGIALYKEGDLEGAIFEFRTALRLAPNDGISHNNLGKALQANGDFVLARKEFEDALRLLPQSSQYQAIIKTIQSNLSDLDKLQR